MKITEEEIIARLIELLDLQQNVKRKYVIKENKE